MTHVHAYMYVYVCSCMCKCACIMESWAGGTGAEGKSLF